MDNDENKSFSPGDLTDGRNNLDWKSRYPSEAQPKIIFECFYLVFYLITIPIFALVSYLNLFPNIFDIHSTTIEPIKPYLFAWLGGCFGGALYGLKWTYHCIAKGIWHMDRRAWRFLTPLIGASFALAFSILISSKFIGIFDPSSTKHLLGAFGVGFLVGYFSDSAAAKLVEISNSIFGSK